MTHESKRLNRADHDCLPAIVFGAAFVLGLFVIALGCQKPDHESLNGEKQTPKTSTVDDVKRTMELRQAYRQATTDQERQKIRDELIPHLQMRYSGIDCNVPQQAIRPHGLAFRLLLTEWDPRKFTLEDLKAVAGKPKSETKDSVTYVFDSGLIAPYWTFKGRPYITSIDYRPGQ